MLRACLTFLIFFFTLLASSPSLISQAQPQDSNDRVDVLIRGGQVLDGSGTDAVQADVGVRDDRIVFVGDSVKAHLQATRVIDASGLFVSPGFIDPHTHADADLLD